jgi:hypothetical protein
MAAAALNEKEMDSVKMPVDVTRHGLAANNLKAEATPAHSVQLIQAQVDRGLLGWQMRVWREGMAAAAAAADVRSG